METAAAPDALVAKAAAALTDTEWLCPVCHERDAPTPTQLPASPASPTPVHTSLLCGHVFHADCFQGWLRACRSARHDENCPVCRSGVADDYVTRIATLDRSAVAEVSADRDMWVVRLRGQTPFRCGWGIGKTLRDHFGPSTAVVFERYSRLRRSVFYRSLTNTSDGTGDKAFASTAFDAHVALYTLNQAKDREEYLRVRGLLERSATPVAVEFVENGVLADAELFLQYLWEMRLTERGLRFIT